jgi:hypothetical protein
MKILQKFFKFSGFHGWRCSDDGQPWRVTLDAPSKHRHPRVYTRWFKYYRDDLCVNKSQRVPVIFEPPCTTLQHLWQNLKSTHGNDSLTNGLQVISLYKLKYLKDKKCPKIVAKRVASSPSLRVDKNTLYWHWLETLAVSSCESTRHQSHKLARISLLSSPCDMPTNVWPRRPAHRRSRYSSTFSSTSALGEGGSLTPRSDRFTPRERDPVPILLEAGWAPGPVRTNAENHALNGIWTPNRPARRESLYGLSYPGPSFHQHTI